MAKIILCDGFQIPVKDFRYDFVRGGYQADIPNNMRLYISNARMSDFPELCEYCLMEWSPSLFHPTTCSHCGAWL